MKSAIIIGYSGHSYVVLDILKHYNYELNGYVDIKENISNPYDLGYIGKETDVFYLDKIKGSDVFICVGDNYIRRRLFVQLENNNINTPFINHPSAQLSSRSYIGPGSIIMAGAIINSMAKVGKGVICNTSAIIEHECLVNDFAHIAPGAVLLGNVFVGENTFIGANSVIKENVSIGNNVVIGAGSVIVKDIPDNSIVYGNPGRLK